MVPIGDIERRDSRESIYEILGLFNGPKLVCHAVFRGDGKKWLFLLNFLDPGVDLRILSIGQEDGARICIETTNVTCSVLFFVVPCSLVLFDEPIFKIVNGTTGDDSALHMASHLLSIQIEAGCLLTNEETLVLEALEVIGGTFIDLIRIGISLGGEFNLWSYDTEKAHGVVFGQATRLFRGDDVIGNGGHAFRIFRNWA